MLYLTQLTTTFSGMHHSFEFTQTLDLAYSNLIISLSKAYPDIDDIYIDAVQSENDDFETDELPYILDEIENIQSDDFSFCKTNNAVTIWFRYNGGDIYATITDVSDQVKLK